MRLKTPTQTRRPDLTPAATFFLMTGTDAPPPCHGWVGLYFDQLAFDHDVRRWGQAVTTPEIAAWLEAAAAAHDFQPWAVTGRRPRGAGVTQWWATFRAEAF